VAAPKVGSQDFRSVLLADTGPTRSSSPYKARSFRIGSQFDGFPKIKPCGHRQGRSRLRGRFHNQNSVNISSPRKRPIANAAVVARLDTKAGLKPAVVRRSSAVLTLYSRPARPLFENHRNVLSHGSLWERAPMFSNRRTIHSGGLKVKPICKSCCRVAGTTQRSLRTTGHCLVTGPAQKATSRPRKPGRPPVPALN